ncbi:MAG: hypothetical protein IT381_02900 [Deltaproteobacteria bacterium]|nr:hypothetical protein [Deltaproteobacteria bacterium]
MTTINRDPGVSNAALAQQKLKAQALVPSAKVSAAAAAAAEALYQAAFSALPTPVSGMSAGGSAATAGTRVDTEPKFAALFDKFIGGEKPQGAIAKDFVREMPEHLAVVVDAEQLIPNPQETPKELRLVVSKIVDAHFALLEKKSGLAPGGKPLEDTPVGQWLCGPKKDVLEKVAQQLGTSLRQATGSPKSAAKTDPLAVGPKEEEAIDEMFRALPSGTISSNADIECCIQLIFLQLGVDSEKDLRDALKTMNDRIAQKKAMREYAQAVRTVQAQAKQQLQNEYATLSQARQIECSFEQFASMRPIDVMMPKLEQTETGKWVVRDGSAKIIEPLWSKDPNSIPEALRPKLDQSTTEGLAMKYGLSEAAILALRELWMASAGANPGTFAEYLETKMKLKKARTPEEAEANRKKAIEVLSSGIPGAPPPKPFDPSKVGVAVTLDKGAKWGTTIKASSSPTGPSREELGMGRQTTEDAGGGETSEGMRQGTGTMKPMVKAETKALMVGITYKKALEETGNSGATPEQARQAAIAALNQSKPPERYGATAGAPLASGGLRLELFDREIDKAKGDLDTVSDQTALEQMQMQRYLERRTKVFETLSNVMKKIAQTVGQIIENTK